MSDVDDLRETTKEAFHEAHESLHAKYFAQTQAMLMIVQAISQIAKQDVSGMLAEQLEILRESTALNSDDDNTLQVKIAEELGELAAYFRD